MATTTAIETETETEPEVDFTPHQITVERFEKMIEAGVFDDDRRVFLWEGKLYEKMTPGISHVYVVTHLRQVLDQIAAGGWFCFEEQPIAVGPTTMPEPDISVVRGTPRDFRTRRATSGDVSLLVEVSVTSHGFDSGAKLRAYATNGIPIYWLVNIPKQQIEVHSSPAGAAYREHRSFGPGELVPVVLDEREVGRIAVDDILT